MARGWESKSVEQQQQEMSERAKPLPAPRRLPISNVTANGKACLFPADASISNCNPFPTRSTA